jgi:hypothetical protein
MKKAIVVAMTALILGLAGMVSAETTVAAGTGTTLGAGSGSNKVPGVRKRGRIQRHRIKDGLKSGELTKDEAKDLRQEGKAIREKVKDAKSDGVVTKEERKDLHKDLNDRSKSIYEKKHNDEKRPKAQ